MFGDIAAAQYPTTGWFPGESFPRCLRCLRPVEDFSLRLYVLPVDEAPCHEAPECQSWNESPRGRLRYGALTALMRCDDGSRLN